MKTIEKLKLTAREQSRVVLQEKALCQMIRRGEADKTKVYIECNIGHHKFEKREFIIWKINNIYRAPYELIQKHRAFLRAKYGDNIPYIYEGHGQSGCKDIDSEL